jgi:hypothetical protein
LLSNFGRINSLNNNDMATIHKNGQNYGTLGTTQTQAGMLVTQYNAKKSSATKEIIGPEGDVQSIAMYNLKTEITVDGYISGTFTGTIGSTAGSSTFIDSINRTFSAEDVAKLTVSKTLYAGLT